MLRVSFVTLLFALASTASHGGEITDCTYNGIELYGTVEIVNAFGDLQISPTIAGGDIKVKFVENFPDSCGKWQVVDAFADFSIEFVKGGEDISVRFVGNFPGVD